MSQSFEVDEVPVVVEVVPGKDVVLGSCHFVLCVLRKNLQRRRRRFEQRQRMCFRGVGKGGTPIWEILKPKKPSANRMKQRNALIVA